MSQRRKQMLYINAYVGEIDDIFCKTEIETQIWRTNLWTPRGASSGWDELGGWD